MPNVAQKFRRDFEMVATRSADSKRTVELSFSSELPVNRGDYLEILSHDPKDCDLSRLNSASPLLLNHEPDEQVGVVESASIGPDRKGRAKVRFGSGQLASEVFQDVKDGIRKLVSVGYRLLDQVGEQILPDGSKALRFAWQPYEISLVSVPADITVGIGRSIQTEKIMSYSTSTPDEIRAIARNLSGKVADVEILAERRILEGATVSQFRAECLDKLPDVQPVSQPTEGRSWNFNAKDLKHYSISRALSRAAIGKPLEGIEAEMNREVELKSGKAASGFWIPDEAFVAKRNFVAGTNTLGGFLVQTDNLGDQFVELLRNRAQVLNLGARVLNLTRPTTIPRQNSAGTVNMIGETTASTLSTGNFTQLTLTPQAASAYQQYSKQLLMEGNPSIDQLIRDDIMQQIGLKIDLCALHGSGSGEPTGIINTAGVGSVVLSANGLSLANSTAYPAMVSLETAVATANADVGALAYLMRAGHRAALKTQQRFANTDSPVYLDGKVNGYRAEVSNQIATNLTAGTATTIASTIFFGNWNDLIIASFGAVDIVSDPFSRAENGIVRILARRWFDCVPRHTGSFACLHGILTT